MMSSSQARLAVLQSHFLSSPTAAQTKTVGDSTKQYPEIVDYNPNLKVKLDYINLQGWGYSDTAIILDPVKDMVKLTGNRYMFSNKYLPNCKKWCQDFAHIDFTKPTPKQKDMEIDPPILNHEFLSELGEKGFSRRSFHKWERINHSCGATIQEVFILRHGKFKRTVDVVIFPENTEQVELMVSLANKHNVVLVPYGGGTNVTQALMLNPQEKRMIVSVDMTRMSKIKWVDKTNMTACIEAGIIGQDLERELKNYGVCCGHEPDSVEFSSLGGWISTRASGMKKNTYGNIEDIVQNVKLVTSKGTYTKLSDWPRISNGPDLNNLVMGHEGNFGIITEAVLRIRNIPPVKKYGSILFYDFETGIKFMDEMARHRVWPASIRLVDNTQFQFGQALKPEADSKSEEIIDAIKKYYVLNIKGFNPQKMAAVTLVFEGTEEEVSYQEKHVYKIAKKYQGMKAGETNGIRGYFLTFMIAYIRDFAAQYKFAAESFETSVPWSKVGALCANVKDKIIQSCREKGVNEQNVFASFRVTQLYETGAAVYVYFGFNYDGLKDEYVVPIYEDVENDVREEIMRNGGSISHHHGVGKIRKRFMNKTMSPTGINFMKDIKESIDPKNVFAINNTIYRLEEMERENSGGGGGWDSDEEYKNENVDYSWNPIMDYTGKKESFKVFTIESIERVQVDKAKELQELLGLNTDQAYQVLRFYKWNLDKIQNEWFEKENKLRKQIGMEFDSTLVKQFPHLTASLQQHNGGYCLICYSQFTTSKTLLQPEQLSCGHQFCKSCWKDYLSQKVKEGSQAIFSKCPQHCCNVIVPHSMFQKYLSGDDLVTYMKWHCKSFTDDNKNVRWCPYQGCDYCVEYQDYGMTEVICKCGNSFCFKCGYESHRPCDCNTTVNWKVKNSNESENINWILANTKQCPNCRKPIEKNQGCNHMTCKMCAYEFCWLCSGKWSDHGQKTGGYYNCNKYEEMKKQDKKLTQDEKKRNEAKNELDKYMFYFERYNNHDKAEKHARQLKPVIRTKIELLHDIKKYPMNELEFLEEAINEVIRCRQVLKYTYVYGYFLISQKDKQLFEFMQENLEKNCDYLHELIEKPLDPFLDQTQIDRKPFYNFKSDLINYYQVTKNFYENLLDGLEKGLTNQ